MWRVIMSWGDCQDYVTLSVHRSRRQAERRMVEAARVLGAMGVVYHVEVVASDEAQKGDFVAAAMAREIEELKLKLREAKREAKRESV